MARLTVPTSIDNVMRPQPRPRPARPVRLTRRGEYAVLVAVLAMLSLLIVVAWFLPVYVVVGAR
jgi:hypothetical protein